MGVLLITRLLRGVRRWARKAVNHTSWVAVITPTDRPKSVRNCCLMELFCGVVYVVTLSLWHFCWYRGFCHRIGSDLLLFVFFSKNDIRGTSYLKLQNYKKYLSYTLPDIVVKRKQESKSTENCLKATILFILRRQAFDVCRILSKLSSVLLTKDMFGSFIFISCVQ